MRSMTGYGGAAEENRRYRVRVTLRSVNHRHLDLALRLPDLQRGSEPALRDLLAARLHRGRVEANVEAGALDLPGPRMVTDAAGLAEVARVLDKLIEREVIEEGLTAGDLLRIPQLVRFEAQEGLWEPADEELLLRVASTALDQLVESRSTEGAKLAAALDEHLAGLTAATAELRRLAEVAPEQAAAALRERLEALLGDHGLDEERLAQEVAILADRGDVREELDRLNAHVEHFREVMAEQAAAATETPPAAGKRLDFLTQEIFRELNTLGAKGRSAPMTRLVLDAKVLCERLREQVQNVE